MNSVAFLSPVADAIINETQFYATWDHKELKWIAYR